MSWLLATVYDPWMKSLERAHGSAWRTELLGELSGDVLEIGAGTGANVAFYPESASRVVLAEPDRHMRRRLERRIASAERDRFEVSPAAVDGLPFADDSFDAVVATLVLCSVSDVDRALANVRRVLRPGGRLVFLEHVADEDPGRSAWQRRAEPIWRRVAGNCHLTRRTVASIERAGFTLEWTADAYLPDALPWVRTVVRGVGVLPSVSTQAA